MAAVRRAGGAFARDVGEARILGCGSHQRGQVGLGRGLSRGGPTTGCPEMARGAGWGAQLVKTESGATVGI